MWSAFPFQFNSSSLLLLFWVAACLASFLPLGLLFYVAVKLKRLNALSMKKSEMQSSMESSGTLLPRESFRPIGIHKVVGMFILGMVISFGMARAAYHQRGYCMATGDFAESDHMTVLSKQGDWFNVLAKDGRIYKFYPCPPSKMGWKSGTVIDYAKYEMRNGCADFSSPLASVIAH